MSEVISVGTDCPLCGGHFFAPEPKYSKMIQQLVRVARAGKVCDDLWDEVATGDKMDTWHDRWYAALDEQKEALKEVEHLLDATD